MLTILAAFISGAITMCAVIYLVRFLRELREWRRHGWRRTYRCPVCGRVSIVRRRTPKPEENPA
jgi:hypothetical protein